MQGVTLLLVSHMKPIGTLIRSTIKNAPNKVQ